LSFLAGAGFVVFIMILFAGIYVSLFGLPGTIIIFLDVLFYALFTGFAEVGWKIILFLLISALLAESLDLWAGSMRVHKVPITKKNLWGAVFGAVAGMIIFTPFFWGLGIWGGFVVGGLAGLLVMEWNRQSHLKSAQKITGGAFLVMITRKALKCVLALIMIFVSLSNIYS
jgi:uncharacterized protein